jgi:hypothetical protein
MTHQKDDSALPLIALMMLSGSRRADEPPSGPSFDEHKFKRELHAHFNRPSESFRRPRFKEDDPFPTFESFEEPSQPEVRRTAPDPFTKTISLDTPAFLAQQMGWKIGQDEGCAGFNAVRAAYFAAKHLATKSAKELAPPTLDMTASLEKALKQVVDLTDARLLEVAKHGEDARLVTVHYGRGYYGSASIWEIKEALGKAEAASDGLFHLALWDKMRPYRNSPSELAPATAEKLSAIADGAPDDWLFSGGFSGIHGYRVIFDGNTGHYRVDAETTPAETATLDSGKIATEQLRPHLRCG